MRRRSPVFLFTGVASLALGIGAAVAILTAAHQLLWKPLPLPEEDRLAFVSEVEPSGAVTGVALQNMLDFRDGASFDAMAGYRRRTFGLRSGSERAVVVPVGLVTSDFFRALGTAPTLGRSFTAEEARADAPVIVLGHELFLSRFGGDSERLGETVLLNDQPRTIVGVLPEGFRFPMGTREPPIAYIPLSHRDYGNKRAVRTLSVVARLSNGISFEAAESELGAIANSLSERFPDTSAGFGVRVAALRETLTSQNRGPLNLLAAAAFGILLIAATNIGSLFIARFTARGREVGIRMALGAKRRDVIALFAAEGLVVGVAGAGAGLLLARAVLQSIPQVLPLLGGFAGVELALEPIGVVFGLAAAIATVLLFSLVPFVLTLRGATPSLLKSGSFVHAPALRLRRVLVVAQVGLGLLLLQTTLLLGTSFSRLSAVHPGFAAENVLSFGIGIPEARYDSEAKMLRFHERLIRELEAIPGVTALGAGTGFQLAGRLNYRAAFRRESESIPRVEWPTVSARLASPDYFRALDIPIVRGRTFSWRDVVDHPRVVMVNGSFERAFFSADGALGQHVVLSWWSPSNPRGSTYEIVGVVADARQLSLRDDALPEIVLPLTQFPVEGASYMIRSERRDAALEASIRESVDTIDATLESIQLRPMTYWVEESVSQERLSLVLAALSGLSALVLAAIGIYGVLTFLVQRRRRELAIRMALGARAQHIGKLVLGEGLRLTIAGAVLGFAGFALVAPVLERQLFGVGLLDAASALGSLVVLTTVAVLASLLPSRTAVRTSPLELLREE